MAFSDTYLAETTRLLAELDTEEIEQCAQILSDLRDDGGRLFVLGVGGSAATASHAVNDFRKICGIEAYAPTDNVAELTARTNDDGWQSTFAAWLYTSRLDERDCVLIFSVGGGGALASQNISSALDVATEANAGILGIVSRDGGYTAHCADACVIVPPLFEARITPHAEGIASVVAHLLCSHPLLSC